MATIPASALRRFKQLERMAAQALAVVSGLHDDVEHEQDQLSREHIALQRNSRWGGVTVDQDGLAVRVVPVETLHNDATGTTRRTAPTAVRIPELDHLSKPIHQTTQRIAALKAEAALAGARAGRLNGAVAVAERALEKHGWRKDR